MLTIRWQRSRKGWSQATQEGLTRQHPVSLFRLHQLGHQLTSRGITKPAIRRLARRGGVKRISGLIYEETRGVLKICKSTPCPFTSYPSMPLYIEIKANIQSSRTSSETLSPTLSTPRGRPSPPSTLSTLSRGRAEPFTVSVLKRIIQPYHHLSVYFVRHYVEWGFRGEEEELHRSSVGVRGAFRFRSILSYLARCL
jgi:hypothetical protein